MIIFLNGPDDYRRREKATSIVAEFRTQHGAPGLDSFDLEEKEEFSRFRDFTKNQSLFEPNKLAVLKNVFSAAGGESVIRELAAELKLAVKQTNLTVLISEREKPNKGFDFLLKKSTKLLVQKFDYLKGSQWETFVADQAEKQGMKLSKHDIGFLAKVYESDTWRLVTELRKISCLASFLKGPAGAAAGKEIKNLDFEIIPDLWELLKKLKSYGLDNRLAALEKLFSLHEPLPKIFNMLIYQWPEKLVQFAAYDVLVKSGKLEYEEALVGLVL